MKTAIIISALLSLAFAAPKATSTVKSSSTKVTSSAAAATTPSVPLCACATGACPATEPEACECIQSAAMECYLAGLAASLNCPSPTFTPCPIAPTVSGVITFGKRAKGSPTLSPVTVSLTIPTVASPTPTCTCDPVLCLESYPDSCVCENEAKIACYDKCGGAAPALVPCPISVPSPVTVSDEPAPTIGSSIVCAGFLGLACPSGMKCIDDPSDDCDPKHGGADCSGICI